MTNLYEKISIEEVIDEALYDDIGVWAKYTASLCKHCGVEPGEIHGCGVDSELAQFCITINDLILVQDIEQLRE